MVTCAKIAEPIVMEFGLWAQSASMNHEKDGGPHPPRVGAILGERVLHCKVYAVSDVSCAETAEPIDLLFGAVDFNGPKQSCVRWGPAVLRDVAMATSY